jgi:protein kinase-like protein/TIR domain-containing protein
MDLSLPQKMERSQAKLFNPGLQCYYLTPYGPITKAIRTSNVLKEEIMPNKSTTKKTTAAKRVKDTKPTRKRERASRSEPAHTSSVSNWGDGKHKRCADVFISYSHDDRVLKDRLLPDSVFWTSVKAVEIWSDDKILPSEDWRDKIRTALHEAKVVVLLVSNTFLKSSFIQNEELPEILQKRKDNNAVVLWIPLEKGLDSKKLNASKLDTIQSAIPLGSPIKQIARESKKGLDDVREQILGQIRRALDSSEWAVKETLRNKYENKYEIDSKIGEGKSRIVYLGRDHDMKRWVTIRALNFKDHGSDKEQLDRFRKSLLDASRVEQIECFINIYDALLDKNPPLCVCQYVEGETLKARLQRRNLPYPHVRDILLRLGRGLDAAHKENFTHLNIKPSNVIIDGQGRAYLSPLNRGRDYYDRVKASWKSFGEEDRAYIVPEFFVLRAPDISPIKCDQYLLGLLGYHMITADYPSRVSDSDPPAALRQFKPLKPITDPTCPDFLQTAVMKMTAPDPNERFATLREAMDHLEQFKDVGLSQARDSYHRIVSNELDEKVLRQLYKAFRKDIKSETARKRFEEMGAREWDRLREMLKESILMLLAYCEFDAAPDNGEPREPTILSRIRRMHHAKFTIPRADYIRFCELLAEILAANDPASNENTEDDIRRAWTYAIAPGLKYMTQNLQ